MLEDYFSNQKDINVSGFSLWLLRFVEVGIRDKVQIILNFEFSGLKDYGVIGSNRKIGKSLFFDEGKKNNLYWQYN